ncbi:SMC-Scp complex subunit ScpB [Kribbella sp. NPDC051620]|uniref:SMC-Scp complex subunit ScpB n=1 Tax=Kribbella sp. NPDC051620 TaxID=3364120 RepID=UPI0037923971
MTDNQTPTDLQDPADAATADVPAETPSAGGVDSSGDGSPTGVAGGEPREGESTPAEPGAGDALDSGTSTEFPTADEVPAEALAAEGVPVEGDVGALLDEVLDDVVVGEDAIDDVTMRRALEAILMVSDEPLPVLAMAKTVGRTVADVAAALVGLSEEYTEQGRGFDLREVGGGWRYYTREDTAQYVEGYVLEGQQARLTQAALETLAVVAYKQPVSRARVSAIRGVNVDGVMRTLISRGLLEEAGPDTESQSTLYRTTSYFLERMGMQSLDDLPELAPYLPEMDDMEEEMAAQSAASTDTPSEDAPTTSEDDNTPLENDLAPPTPLPTDADTDPDEDPDDAPADSDPAAESEPIEEAASDQVEHGEATDEAAPVNGAASADDEPADEAGSTDDEADSGDDEPADVGVEQSGSADELTGDGDDAEAIEPGGSDEFDDEQADGGDGADEVQVTDGADAAQSEADGEAGVAGSIDGVEGAGSGRVGVGDETVGGPGLGAGESKSGLND